MLNRNAELFECFKHVNWEYLKKWVDAICSLLEKFISTKIRYIWHVLAIYMSKKSLPKSYFGKKSSSNQLALILFFSTCARAVSLLFSILSCCLSSKYIIQQMDLKLNCYRLQPVRERKKKSHVQFFSQIHFELFTAAGELLYVLLH